MWLPPALLAQMAATSPRSIGIASSESPSVKSDGKWVTALETGQHEELPWGAGIDNNLVWAEMVGASK